ncbi:unnamed protein product [Moneuplotes crassus]|uniref:Serine/threonine-protein phosphatase n=2 Tax=Euplotes crassus TaxID=5936 RepID=A0AAD1XH30_EUPCR|nr:unnamed protein product [Moneuplotes crassus]
MSDTEDDITKHPLGKYLDEEMEPTSSKKFDIDALIEQAKEGQFFDPVTIKLICLKARELLVEEENVVQVSAPVSLVGDIHGQFHDLLEIFKIGGEIPHTNYLFLGDYVDRGAYSIETIMLLILFKIRYPQRVTLLRGNHESRQITQIYGFYTECQRKYGNPNAWKYVTDLFDYLPIAAFIDDSIFCVHGGLSPLLQNIDYVKEINRFREIPHEGAFADLMWSDPDADLDGFKISPRGAGFQFGCDVVKRFIECNNISKIYRAHQLCMEGYLILFDGTMNTVWSAPNYCYRYGNLASINEIDEHLNDFFNVFSCSPENAEESKDNDGDRVKTPLSSKSKHKEIDYFL